jgi:hypothetical protein
MTVEHADITKDLVAKYGHSPHGRGFRKVRTAHIELRANAKPKLGAKK